MLYTPGGPSRVRGTTEEGPSVETMEEIMAKVASQGDTIDTMIKLMEGITREQQAQEKDF